MEMTRSEWEYGVPDGALQIRNGETWGIYVTLSQFAFTETYTTHI